MKKIKVFSFYSSIMLTIFPLIALSTNQILPKSQYSDNKIKQESLTTKPLNNAAISVFQNPLYGTKSYLDANKVKNSYFGNSPLSINSINQVQNNQYFFNWIKNDDDPNSLIQIIATPKDSYDQYNIIKLNTDFVQISDSAIYKNGNIILIGTNLNGDKILSVYKIQPKYSNVNIHSRILLLKDSYDLPKYGNDFDKDIKYGLSPYDEQLSDGSTDLILFPVYATANNFLNHNDTILKHILISPNGKITVRNFQINFSMPNNPGFISSDKLTSLNAYIWDGRICFFAYFCHPNENGVLSGVQFYLKKESCLQNNETVFNLNSTPQKKFLLANPNRIIPYGLVRDSSYIDLEGNKIKRINIYWIMQNDVIDLTPNRDTKVPETLFMSQTRIDNDNFLKSIYSNSIMDKNSSGGIVGNPYINQISYDSRGELDSDNPTFIGIVYNDGYSQSIDNNRFNLTLSDIKLDQKDFLISKENLSKWIRLHSSYATKAVLSHADTPQFAGSIYDGTYYAVGIDPYTSDGKPISNPSFNIRKYQANNFIDDMSSNWVKSNIVLPFSKEEAKKYYPQDTSFDNIFTQTKDFNYSFQNPIETDVSYNSPLWYSRNFIDNITTNQLDLKKSWDKMYIKGNPIFLDKDGKNIGSVDYKPNYKTKISIFNVFQKGYIQNGIKISVDGKGIYNSFIFYDNPKDANIASFNKGSLSKFASYHNGYIDLFKNSGYTNIFGTSIKEKIVPHGQNTIGVGNNNLININYTFLNNFYTGINYGINDFLGEIKGNISFIDQNDDLINVSFLINGFMSYLIIIIIVFIFIISSSASLLTYILVKKSIIKKDSSKIKYKSFQISNKLNNNREQEYKKSMIDHIKLTTASSNNSIKIGNKSQNQNTINPLKTNIGNKIKPIKRK
ncbi:MAG: hypothetical protein ACRCW6_02345 [Mycoplasmoidaceae bacterium]